MNVVATVYDMFKNFVLGLIIVYILAERKLYLDDWCTTMMATVIRQFFCFPFPF